MNIRPYMDALRANGGAWGYRWDTKGGGCRMVAVSRLYRGKEPVTESEARQGDRFLTLQLWDDGGHRVSHGLVTKDGPVREQGPSWVHETTYPTEFWTPTEMIIAIGHELARSDHKP